MTYEELLLEAESLGLIVKEKPLKGYNGRIKANRIAIKNNIFNVAKKCTLAEELGHHYTTVGNIIDQSKVRNRKQELQARRWAIKKLVTINNIIKAYEAGCQSIYEMAEYLEVTEDFFRKSLKQYAAMYGPYKKLDNYIICFDPPAILKMFEE